MQRQRRVLVDLDGICADFLGSLLTRYHVITGEKVRARDITDWDMTKFVSHPEALKGIFMGRDFFNQLPEIRGAAWALRTLTEEKLRDGTPAYDVVIVSTPCTPWSASEKLVWCGEHLPFIPFKNIWLGRRKYQIKGDFLIDDSIDNAASYLNEWPAAHTIGLGYGYNLDHNHAFSYRIGDYGDYGEDMAEAWYEVVSTIRKLSR